MSVTKTSKKVLVFISASAGELDWIHPIVHYLNSKKYKISIVYLSRRAESSVKENVTLHDFINHQCAEVISCGGYFFEFIDKYGYLLNRIKIKLGLVSVLNFFFLLLDTIFGAVYLHKICERSGLNSKDQFLIFSEFPNLRRARNTWVKKRFTNSTFFYHPHSTNINLDLEQYSNIRFPSCYKGNEFLLLAHPGEYLKIKKTLGLNYPDLPVVYLGHPKYSKEWLAQYKTKVSTKSLNDKTVSILVISRGHGSFIDENQHINLIDSVVKIARRVFSEYRIIVKRHPRENTSYWSNVAKKNASVQFTENHIMQVVEKVDFAISFWSSAALDCNLLGLPVIEFFNPNESKKSVSHGVSKGDTVYRKLGVVTPANTEIELVEAMQKIKQDNYHQSLDHQHPFVNDMLQYSNDWKSEFDKILSINDFSKHG